MSKQPHMWNKLRIRVSDCAWISGYREWSACSMSETENDGQNKIEKSRSEPKRVAVDGRYYYIFIYIHMKIERLPINIHKAQIAGCVQRSCHSQIFSLTECEILCVYVHMWWIFFPISESQTSGWWNVRLWTAKIPSIIHTHTLAHTRSICEMKIMAFVKIVHPWDLCVHTATAMRQWWWAMGDSPFK